jgi:hypothetical protein
MLYPSLRKNLRAAFISLCTVYGAFSLTGLSLGRSKSYMRFIFYSLVGTDIFNATLQPALQSFVAFSFSLFVYLIAI